MTTHAVFVCLPRNYTTKRVSLGNQLVVVICVAIAVSARRVCIFSKNVHHSTSEFGEANRHRQSRDEIKKKEARDHVKPFDCEKTKTQRRKTNDDDNDQHKQPQYGYALALDSTRPLPRDKRPYPAAGSNKTRLIQHPDAGVHWKFEWSHHPPRKNPLRSAEPPHDERTGGRRRAVQTPRRLSYGVSRGSTSKTQVLAETKRRTKHALQTCVRVWTNPKTIPIASFGSVDDASRGGARDSRTLSQQPPIYISLHPL